MIVSLVCSRCYKRFNRNADEPGLSSCCSALLVRASKLNKKQNEFAKKELEELSRNESLGMWIMPLGIISNDEFKNELIHLGIIKESEDRGEAEIIDIERGRGNKEETPEVIRNIVAEESIMGARSAELTRLFNVSPSSISAYKHGATSTKTYYEPNEKLKTHTNQVRARITRKANRRLISALDAITPEALADIKPRDAAAIAKDMSAVIKNIEPAKEHDGADGPKFVIYAPQLRQENEYNIIHVAD